MKTIDLRRAVPGLALVLTLVSSGCQTPEPFDYALFHAHQPRSILVLPPIDDTMEVDASYAYLPTVTRPIAERGYYVFPVAVVTRMMRENGLLGPSEMQAAPLDKIDEIFGADAVLYLTLDDWGTSYRVLDSATSVTVHGRLVDVQTGTEIWSGTAQAVQSSSAGAGSIGEMLVGAVVNQVMTSAFDPSEDVARQANGMLCNTEGQGLLLGPYHPEYGSE